jgi:hypothetical protein
MQNQRWSEIMPNIVAVDTGALLTERVDIAVVVGGAFVWDAATGELADQAAEHFCRALVAWTETPVECLLMDEPVSYEPIAERIRQRMRLEAPTSPRRQIAEEMIAFLEGVNFHPLSGKRVLWRLPMDAQETDITKRLQTAMRRAMRWASAVSNTAGEPARPASAQDIVTALYMLSDPVRAQRIAPPLHALPAHVLRQGRASESRVVTAAVQRPTSLQRE